MFVAIESYSIQTTAGDLPENQITIKFVICDKKAMSPKDYQPIIDRLQAVCKEFRYKEALKNG